MYGIMEALDNVLHFETAEAHCDIPCGIYDPHLAQVAAHTVVRMDMLIADLAKSNDMTPDGRNKMIRYTMIKEQHAELCKHEVRIIWGDYFKPEHAQANPELHTLVWDIMKAASKAKQGTSMADAEALLEKVNRFAEIFWKTKNIQTARVKAPYPTEKDIVVPKL
ncbi:MAG: superoxide dismutase, Ni [Candidatus Marsarchaeota archaeon]|jgi:nickel superoxide dismutase|nr:superoxide dismutase, Ni [Candidatus Marsarchaeota archaeon]MCL5111363.1 superoxide dismutase, Ni [Candidatus Marsarchaeota archaeon]